MVYGQGTGTGTGRGNGRGKSDKKADRSDQKRTYSNVSTIQIYTANGVEIYSMGTKSGKSKKGTDNKIEKVVTASKVISIYFQSQKEDGRVIDLKCEDCIVLLDYIKHKDARKE